MFNIFKQFKKTDEEKLKAKRKRIEKEAFNAYFNKETRKDHIYYVAANQIRESFNESDDNHAIGMIKRANIIQKAYEDGMADLRKQFLGMPTTQWYIDYDIDYPNSRKE